MNTNIFKIYGAYNWSEKDESGKTKKLKNSIIALSSLIEQIKTRTKNKSNLKINYNRLRATAGSFLIDGINNRIRNSNAIIFDITSFNPNVMFELGISIESSRNNNGAKIYIICQGKSIEDVKIPSDLQGYFISFYEIKNDKVVFHDNNSLAMRLVSDIEEFVFPKE
jgi:predicted nucleotide-binding protein